MSFKNANKRRLSIEMDDGEEPQKKRQKMNEPDDKMKELMEKYRLKAQENLALKHNLLNKVIGIGDDFNFPNIEEFVKEYKVFVNQTHNNLLNALLDILEEIIENDESESEDEDVDIEMDNNDKPDIQSIKLHKIAYHMLYNIISKCYQAMSERKDTFYKIIRQLLHLKNKQKVNDKISMFIDSYLQFKWNTFVQNKYYTIKVNQNQTSKKKKKKKDKQKFCKNPYISKKFETHQDIQYLAMMRNKKSKKK